jgi:hypothetical protein
MVTPASAERDDQLVDVPGGGRVQAGRGLVEEQDLRIAEQSPGQGYSLAQTVRQGAAGIAGPVDQVHRPQCAVNAIRWVGRVVQLGEAFEVLDYAQAQVEPRGLGHDRDPPTDLHAFSGVSDIPATVAEPDVGAMSVPSVRTVVVFPAPFGPRNPKISP